MMNPEQILTDLVIKVEELHKSGVVEIHICHWLGELRVLPKNHTDKPHYVLEYIGQEKLNKGLTSRAWNILLNKIANITKVKV